MNLDVPDGELMILVGPSGCGKSTALRMVAGLEDISDGELKIGGQVVNDEGPQGPRHRDGVPELRAVPAHDRAREHGLRAEARQDAASKRSTRRSTRPRRSSTSSSISTASPPTCPAASASASRWVARSSATRSVFLMDEPLSNLDAKLRVQMRTEISRIQQRLETTTIYVTHDQTEAMTLGDRIAVMRAGILQQVGPPSELYGHPEQPVRGGLHRVALDELPGRRDQRRQRAPADRRRPDPRRAPPSARVRPGRRAPWRRSPACDPSTSRTPASCRTARADHVQGEDRRARVDGVGVLRLLRRRVRAGVLALSSRSWRPTRAAPTCRPPRAASRSPRGWAPKARCSQGAGGRAVVRLDASAAVRPRVGTEPPRSGRSPDVEAGIDVDAGPGRNPAASPPDS